jgi:hypothetical protein
MASMLHTSLLDLNDPAAAAAAFATGAEEPPEEGPDQLLPPAVGSGLAYAGMGAAEVVHASSW